MHWLDDLPGRLPESMRGPLRGFPDIRAAWNGCPSGPWLLRLAHAATQDPLVRRDFHDLAIELSHDVRVELEKHQAASAEPQEGDPVALALDYLIVELTAAADGQGPEQTPHRATARPMQVFDATVSDRHKKIAAQIRERYPHPP